MKKLLLNVKSILIFLYMGLMIAFPLGTFILVGVLKNILPHVRSAGLSYHFETALTFFFILLYLIITFFLTVNFYYWYRLSKQILTKVLLLLILTGVAAASISYWFSPSGNKNNFYAITTNNRFTIGPYPDLKLMYQLKEQRYTTIISLLSNLVVPFEPYLLQEEKINAAKANLELIHIPMLPWVSTNDQAIKEIEKIVRTTDQKKYYVHCYFGEDRVLIAKRLIAKHLPFKNTAIKTKSSSEKKLEFSRGRAIWLDKNVLMSPMMSNLQDFMYIINNFNINTVVSLNSENSASDPVNLIKGSIQKYNFKLVQYPLKSYPYEPEEVLKAANKVKTLKPPVLVYDYYMPPLSVIAEGFIQSYTTGLPSISAALFKESLKNGKAQTVKTNLVIGPEPQEKEFEYLGNLGVRNFAYIGRCTNVKKPEFFRRKVNKLSWECFEWDRKGLSKRLTEKGPWYIYGPDAEKVKNKIIDRE
ncbi:hypothetical protein ACQUW5_03000 [Legionella sp. CNM-1927-20]|uniref:hypothetical protein n=1 Tax=Legionella sp. CNM-1927-20 TaxID=3422221 RepID=UPI00403ABFF8